MLSSDDFGSSAERDGGRHRLSVVGVWRAVKSATGDGWGILADPADASRLVPAWRTPIPSR
jgi:hypothetical protein